jgi:hypothetical protein
MGVHFVGPVQDSVGICIIVPQAIVPAVDEAELAILVLEEGGVMSSRGGLVVLGGAGPSHVMAALMVEWRGEARNLFLVEQ